MSEMPRQFVSHAQQERFGNSSDHVSASEKKGRFGRPRASARPIGLAVMREGLLQPDINDGGKRKLEALILAKEEGYEQAAREFEVSKATLYRWFDKLKQANGNPSVLNESESKPVDVENNTSEIVDELFPEELYVSTVTHPETGVEYKVIDVETVKSFVQTEQRYLGHRVRQELLAVTIMERHKDAKVLTKKQVEKGEFYPKRLFYFPTSVAAATKSISIADTDEFHLPLWELSHNGVFSDRESKYPVQSGEELNSYEAKAALLIFHPHYGDARRDQETGRLKVKNPHFDPSEPEGPDNKKREFYGRRILKKFGLLRVLQKEKGDISRSLRKGMEEELPHLLSNGELKLSDVRGMGEIESKPISANAFVMFDSVNLYVGRRFGGDTAVPFCDGRASIMREVNGQNVLKGGFNLITKEEAGAEYSAKDGQVYARANGPQTQPKEIKYEKLVPKDQEGLQGALRESKIRELQRLVTDRFTDLVEVANSAETLVGSESADLTNEQKEELTEQVRALLLQQAEKVIDIAVAATDADSLKDDLETYTFDKRAFTSLVQSLGVEAMLSNPLREAFSEDLTQVQKNRMLELMRKNYETLYPGDEYEEFRTKVEAGLQSSFENPSTQFYVLEDNGEIVSFNRFDEVRDSSGRQIKYFGSFNADSTYRGVGSEMLEKTIEAQMQNCEVMFAHCDPKMAISQKYIEDGFVATQTETVAGNFSFEIWRSVSVTESLETKQMSKENLAALANISTGPEDDYFVREVEADDAFDELDSGLSYLLTRYFTHRGKTYVAFEINTSVSKDFMLKNSSQD